MSVLLASSSDNVVWCFEFEHCDRLCLEIRGLQLSVGLACSRKRRSVPLVSCQKPTLLEIDCLKNGTSPERQNQLRVFFASSAVAPTPHLEVALAAH